MKWYEQKRKFKLPWRVVRAEEEPMKENGTNKTLIGVLVSVVTLAGIVLSVGAWRGSSDEKFKSIPEIKEGLKDANLRLYNHETRISVIEDKMNAELEGISKGIESLNSKLDKINKK